MEDKLVQRGMMGPESSYISQIAAKEDETYLVAALMSSPIEIAMSCEGDEVAVRDRCQVDSVPPNPCGMKLQKQRYYVLKIKQRATECLGSVYKRTCL